MNSLLADLNVDSKFIMVAGVFFTLTFLISTIIVIFITKIRSLKYIIEQAKEIDRAKIEKIKRLESEIEVYRRKNEELDRELRFLPRNKERLNSALEYIESLKEQMERDTKEYIDLLNKQKLTIEQLKIRYDVLSKNCARLEDRYQRLKKRNDILISENSNLNSKLKSLDRGRRY
jgi:cell division protein FtsB